MTPGEAVTENVVWLMEQRRLSQEAVAQRMQHLGFGWYRRTVNRLIRGERRLDVDELFGLALALDTTVAMLAGPSLRASHEDGPFEGDYQIGALPTLNNWRYSMLLSRLDGADSFARTRVHWASIDEEDKPQWMPFTPKLFDQIRSALADGGWADEEEFLEAHPEVEPLPISKLVPFIEANPKSQE